MQARTEKARRKLNGEDPMKPLAAEVVAKPVDRERDLHEQIKKFCDNQWPRWKYINSRWGVPSTIAPGCQDFTIFATFGRPFCIECKKGNEKPDPEQLAWHHEMSMVGFPVHVVRSYEEFLKIVQ